MYKLLKINEYNSVLESDNPQDDIERLLLSNEETNIDLAFTLMQSQQLSYTKDLIELFKLCKINYNNNKNVKAFLLQDTLDLSNKKLKSIPSIVIKTNFKNYDFSRNKLVSLENSPQNIKGYFDCSHNQLTSLDGSPQTINGAFECGFNLLTTLKGCPAL